MVWNAWMAFIFYGQKIKRKSARLWQLDALTPLIFQHRRSYRPRFPLHRRLHNRNRPHHQTIKRERRPTSRSKLARKEMPQPKILRPLHLKHPRRKEPRQSQTFRLMHAGRKEQRTRHQKKNRETSSIVRRALMWLVSSTTEVHDQNLYSQSR